MEPNALYKIFCPEILRPLTSQKDKLIYLALEARSRQSNRSEEGLTLETSAFKLCTVASLRYQLS